MRRRLYAGLRCGVASFALLFISPAFAADLPTLLAPDRVTIDGYQLAKDDVTAFYALRDNSPAWTMVGPENTKAFASFLQSLNDTIEVQGLRPEDYPLDQLSKLAGSTDDDAKLKLDLLITDTLLLLAHDLHGDTGNLERIYTGWNYERTDIDIPALLADAVANNNVDTLIAGMPPHHPEYAFLIKALTTYRVLAAAGDWPVIEPGPTLRLNDHGPRIAELRARLAAEKYDTGKTKKPATFDVQLHKAVAAWQHNNGLATDGDVGTATLYALNVPVQFRVEQIRANLERWRHIPDDFPPQRYVLVNIPDASVDIIDGGKSIYQGPVIVGRNDRPTPFIQSIIKSMIINPSWHVPTKIARKDILPKLRKDPHYLEKLGFVIKDRDKDPYGENIDWNKTSETDFNYKLRQEPGDQNSLGRLKFDFENDFAVYMHGTPHQELFKKQIRNLSSGCVRLRDPEQVAQILLAANPGDWTVQKIDDAINEGDTHWIGLKQETPIFILYWTVFADENGNVNFRNDVYDYDATLMDVTPQEHPPKEAALKEQAAKVAAPAALPAPASVLDRSGETHAQPEYPDTQQHR